MRVAIIDPYTPDVVTYGESDLRRHDQIFVRVVKDGIADRSAAMQMTAAAYVYSVEHIDEVQAEFLKMREEKRALELDHWQRLSDVRSKWGAKP